MAASDGAVNLTVTRRARLDSNPGGFDMKHSAAITAVSWIPRGSVTGTARIPFDLGLTHYDQAPPDRLGDLAIWCAEDRFREANQLRGWIEVQGGRIADHGCDGRGHLGSTTVDLGVTRIVVPGRSRRLLRPAPEVTATSVTFTQTVGGRTGVPFPRPVRRAPFLAFFSATAWTTLSLTLHADGRVERGLVGASPFPCHSIFDENGGLIGQTAETDCGTWFSTCFGRYTPWAGRDLTPMPLAEPASETELLRAS